MERIKVRFQALVSFKYLATFSAYHLTPGQRRLLMLFGRHNDKTTTNKRIKTYILHLFSNVPEQYLISSQYLYYTRTNYYQVNILSNFCARMLVVLHIPFLLYYLK